MAFPLEARFAALDLLPVNTATRMDFDDQPLVRAAQAGDRAAFGQLYQRYARMVHGLLLARVPVSAAEDLVQDVFLQALPRMKSLRDTSRFGAWLAAIARNRAMDFHRRAKPDTSFEAQIGTIEVNQSSKNSVALEDGMTLLNALRELPEAYREPLILRFVEGMTGPEIAERTGLTHGSVRVNLHRGMQMLREKWQGSETRLENEKQL
ncbi:MAG TPA: sigma-70 family RNA polymerase sigma factor [Candidatus Acidoferrum sp.]|jgi:RNA polymerase sigma-70 factor (ECF subfamily)